MVALNQQVNKSYYINKKSLSSRRKTIIIGIIWIFVLMISIITFVSPNNKKEIPYKNIGLVINGIVVDTTSSPKIINSDPLIEYSDIKKYINSDILFDLEDNMLILTTKEKVARIKVGETSGLINNKPLVLKNKIISDNSKIYIPIGEFEELYNINVNYYKENNAVVIDTDKIIYNCGISVSDKVKVRKKIDNKSEVITRLKKNEQFQIVEVDEVAYKILTNGNQSGYINKEDVAIIDSLIKIGKAKNNRSVVRENNSIKEPIFKKLVQGESVKIFAQIDDWYKVRTNDGIIGFIKKSQINEIEEVKSASRVEEKPIWKPVSGKINLVWEQIENSTPPMHNVDRVDGLDVVCPTWFEVIRSDGTLKNKADSSYVRWARGNGYKVWGLVSNGVSTNSTKMTNEFLNSAFAREKAINELIKCANTYNLDGLNVDFEHFEVKDKDMYTQFIRELAPLCKDKGLVLSIDVTVIVDSPNSLCFDRKALSEISDYVIAMTYDQHWATSPISGSVAQYSWVEENIKLLLNEIPKEKFIMGIPFYSRQWKEIANQKPISASISMANSKNIIRQYGAKVVWDDKSGQDYAEFTIDKIKYRIWIEDAKSINLKSSLALKYDLSGVASWRRGYETYDIWNVLNKNTKEFNDYENWKNQK